MAYSICKIKNLTGEVTDFRDKLFQIDEVYQIPDLKRIAWANDDNVITALSNGSFQIHDADGAVSGLNKQIDLLKNSIEQDVRVSNTVVNNPFSNKMIETAVGVKKLYARIHGIQSELSAGTNTIDFATPYPWVKITGIMIFGGELLDKADICIYDTATGTYSGIPNYKLNQFGFSANVGKDNFEWTSPYDADLYQGMIVKIIYTSISDKTIAINFVLNEVKD